MLHVLTGVEVWVQAQQGQLGSAAGTPAAAWHLLRGGITPSPGTMTVRLSIAGLPLVNSWRSLDLACRWRVSDRLILLVFGLRLATAS
jgi:hypothetical protein